MARGYLPDIPFDLWAQDQSQQFEQYTQQQDEAQKFREQTADISAPAVGTWPDPYEVLARPQPDPEPFYSPAPPAQDTTSPVPDDGGLPSPDAMAHYYGLPSAGDSGPNDFLPTTEVAPAQPDDGGADFTPRPTDSASSLLPSPDEMAQQYGLESPSGTDRPDSSSPVDPSAGAAAPQEAEGFLPQFTKAVGSAVGSAVKSIFGDRDSGLTGALNATSDNLAGALNREAAPTPEQVEARIAPYRDINPVQAGIEYNKPLRAFREEVHNVGEHLGSARESLAEQGPTPGGIGGAVGQTALAGLSALNTTFSPIKAAVNQWFPEGTGIETPAGTITPGDIVINATLPRDAVHVAKGLLHVGQGALDLLNSARSKEQAETVIQGLAARAQAGEGIAATAKSAAALDPIGKAPEATFETGLGLAGRAAEEVAPLAEDAARTLGDEGEVLYRGAVGRFDPATHETSDLGATYLSTSPSRATQWGPSVTEARLSPDARVLDTATDDGEAVYMDAVRRIGGSRAAADPAAVHEELARQGYDAVRYGNSDVAVLPDGLRHLAVNDAVTPGLGGLAGAASEDTLDEEDQSPQDRALRTGLGFAAGMAFRKNKPDPRLFNHPDPAVANFVRQFHAKAPELNPIGTVEKVRRGFVKEMTDRLVDLGAAQADVEKSANVLRWNSATRSLNNYIFSDADRALEWARTNAPVAARQRFQEIEDRVLDLVDRVGARDALRAYIAGRHQLTQDAIYPGRTFPSGLKADEVRDVLDKVEADVRSRPDGDAIWDRVVQAGDNVASYTKDLLRERRDAGIISDELYKDLVTKYPYYVPTKILTHIDQVSNGGLVSSGKRFTLADQDIRKLLAEGTDKEMLDPLKGLALLTLSTKQQIRKNSVFQAIDRWREIDPDFMGKLITEVPHDVDYDARTHALFPGWVNGEKKYLQVPAALAPMFMEEPLARIGPPLIGTWMSMVAGTITRKFPPFALVGNPMMDLASYGIRAGTWELAHAATHGNPLERTVGVLMAYPRVMADIAQALPEVFQGLGKGRFYGATAQLRESGGGQSGWFGHGMDQKSLESLDKAFEDLGYRPLVLSNAEAIGRAMKDLASFTPVEALGERFELIPRVAAYKGALRRGETELQAMIRGREVTIDFQKGGTFVKVLNQALPFTNATVQSAAQVYRTFHDNPRAAAITVASAIVGPTALVEAWNRGDPERAKAWDQVPDSTKYRYLALVSPNPWTTNREGERAPNVLLIPTAREFVPIMNLTRTLMARQYGDDHEAWGDLIRNGLVAPLSPVAMNNGTDFINSLLPPPFDVVHGLATDTDPFSGGKLSSKFRAERAGPSAQIASELLNKVPFVHSTAGQTEYGMRNSFGGVGQMATGAADLTLQHAGDLAGTVRGLSGGRLDLTGALQNRYRVPTATETNPSATRIQDTPVVGGLVGRFYRQAEGGDLEKARGAKVSEKLDKALSASGVSYRPADVAPTIRNMSLTRQELARYQDTSNRLFDAGMRELMAEPDWAEYSSAEKEQIVRRMAERAHKLAGAQILDTIDSSEIDRRVEAAGR